VTSSRLLLAVYWGPRSAGLAESVELLSDTFSALAEAGYVEWRHKGMSRKKAETLPFAANDVSIAQLLRVNRRDFDNSPIPELGYSFGLWSGGREDRAYELSGGVGNTTQIGKNCILLTLPAVGPLSFLDNEVAVLSLFERLVLMSKADQGIVCDPNAIEWVDRRLSSRIPAKARHDAA
jgi:hypothetical protein